MKQPPFSLLLLLLLAMVQSALGQTALGGRQGLYDRHTNTLLFSVPAAVFGTDCTLVIDGQTYTFSQVEGGRAYPCGSRNVTFTFLPIVHIEGSDFSSDYRDATVSLLMPDGSSLTGLTARIKWRGGSTAGEGKHKHNYKIKFSEDHRFFGLRSDNNWILDAGQADAFRLRNLIAAELWNDFAHKPYYFDEDPRALSALRGQVVEVFIGEEYVGVYNFCECMDRKQLRLKKFTAGGEVRGTLWKSKGYGCSMMYNVPESYDNHSGMMDVFEAKYPDLGDLDSTDYSTLWNAIDFVVHSSDWDFAAHVADYFDLPVVLDYYLFVHLLNAIDNEGKNMYWAVFDKTRSKMITPAMWDMDISVGERFAEQFSPAFTSPEFDSGDALYLITRLKRLDVNAFNTKVVERWRELRQTHFSLECLTARYEHYANLLIGCGAAGREQARWSGDSDLFGDVIDFDAEVRYITAWLTRRLKYLDENHFDYAAPSGIQSPRLPQRPEAAWGLDGRPWSGRGPYIQNGRVFVGRRRGAAVGTHAARVHGD